MKLVKHVKLKISYPSGKHYQFESDLPHMYAILSQLVEETGLKPVQSQFKSEEGQTYAFVCELTTWKDKLLLSKRVNCSMHKRS